MPKKFRLLQGLAILINLIVAFALAVMPHAFYYGVAFENGEQPQNPFLSYYAPWFYAAGFGFLFMTWVFWTAKRNWLRLPIGLYSFLAVFMALAQGVVLRHNWLEGLVLYACTVFPLILMVVLSFWLGRARH